MGVKIVGDKKLMMRFKTAGMKLRRGPLRRGVDRAGMALVSEIKNNISRMVGESSATRISSPPSSRDVKTSLRNSVGMRRWPSRLSRTVGVVVGPKWPEGKHGHLIEFGHEVVSHGKRTGIRTRPRPFQRRAMVSARSAVKMAIAGALRRGLRMLGR